jgi:hypothetical protein
MASCFKLGIGVAQSTVAKYMAKRRPGSSGQTWKTFLRNHAPGIAGMDFLVVPTINFRLLFVRHKFSLVASCPPPPLNVKTSSSVSEQIAAHPGPSQVA